MSYYWETPPPILVTRNSKNAYTQQYYGYGSETLLDKFDVDQ